MSPRIDNYGDENGFSKYPTYFPFSNLKNMLFKSNGQNV